jgi:hypothetical protein
MKFMIALTACCLLLLTDQSSGEIVKWTDEDGQVHFGDRVPEQYQDNSESVQVGTPNLIDSNNNPVNFDPDKRNQPDEEESEEEKVTHTAQGNIED